LSRAAATARSCGRQLRRVHRCTRSGAWCRCQEGIRRAEREAWSWEERGAAEGSSQRRARPHQSSQPNRAPSRQLKGKVNRGHRNPRARSRQPRPAGDRRRACCSRESRCRSPAPRSKTAASARSPCRSRDAPRGRSRQNRRARRMPSPTPEAPPERPAREPRSLADAGSPLEYTVSHRFPRPAVTSGWR
jgi:hypothetical protein